MGIYVFETRFLLDLLRRDQADASSQHDFGRDLIPHVVRHGKAVAHQFSQSCVMTGTEKEPYWRDVGTIDAFWQANIDLTQFEPALDLYSQDWPIWTYAELTPPAKFVHNEDGRRGMAVSSMVSGGCVVSGAGVAESLLFTGVHVRSYSTLLRVVALPYSVVGRRCRLENVVLDRGVVLPEGLVVGEDPEADARRFRRTETGVTLITQPMIDALGG
jgi:glucose-1-phosphate adenylyltransferase